MPKKKVFDIPFEYGFPLFVPDVPKSYLIKLQKIRLSDIWGFWDYIIKIHSLKRGRISGNFLPTLLEQAKYFYEAAEKAPMKSQPLLYYYSFLNIAKIVININYPCGKTIEYYHGIETKVNETTTLENAEVSFKQYTGLGGSKISVAKEFLQMMGDSIRVPQVTKVKDLLASCVGVHRTYSETFNQKETFYRLENIQSIKRTAKTITYESNVKGIDDVVMASLISSRNYNISKKEEDGKKLYVFKEEYNMADYNVALIRWRTLANQIRQKGIWSYTDGNQFRLYISKDAVSLSSPSIIYCLMFFLGSVTRYHPYFFESILNAKEQWLVSEFLRTQPMQFMYMVTSQMVGNYIYKSRTYNI